MARYHVPWCPVIMFTLMCITSADLLTFTHSVQELCNVTSEGASTRFSLKYYRSVFFFQWNRKWPHQHMNLGSGSPAPFPLSNLLSTGLLITANRECFECKTVKTVYYIYSRYVKYILKSYDVRLQYVIAMRTMIRKWLNTCSPARVSGFRVQTLSSVTQQTCKRIIQF